MGPRLLLLDEITSALDPELVGEVLGIVRELAHEGMTMVLATHEMTFAHDVSDIVCFLADGSVCESGPPEAILVSPRQQRTQAFLRRILQANRI
jgi:polar amino acid transport system ATP-binding protein